MNEASAPCSDRPTLAVETRNLTKFYKLGSTEVKALRGVDFRAASDDFIVINGPSGSGKTTFLNLIACIDRPSQGEVLIEDKQTSSLSEGQLADLRKQTIGLIFQTFNLIPVLSAAENVEYPLLLRNLSRSERKKRVKDILGEVGLTEYSNRRPDQLSGGQRQRVAVARALVSESKIVLADEPTANLDTDTGKQVMELMRRLNQEHCVAFIVVTHDPVVSEYAKRRVSIRDGAIIEGEINVVAPAAA
jgi:putative ABC transport system ATP-binding protein